MCVQNNQLKTLIYLKEESHNKLNLNHKNNIGDTVLHKSARSGCVAICAYLLTTNMNPLIQNEEGWTALMEATYTGNK